MNPHVSFERIFIYALENSNKIIIQGKDASFESENLPLYIYNAEFTTIPQKYSFFSRKILIAQQSISKTQIQRLSRLLNNENLVGFMETLEFSRHSNTHIVFTNHDILMKKLLIDPLLTEYSVIIIEDIYKRNIISNALISLLTTVSSFRRIRLVLTICSGDSLALTSYFKNHSSFSDNKVTVLGSYDNLKPINYLKEPTPNYLDAAFNIVYNIHKNEDPGDILVFLPRDNDVNYFVSSINTSSTRKQDRFQLLALIPEDYTKKYASLNRKVYVTNATKPFSMQNIQFVVDSCLDKYTKTHKNGHLQQTIRIAPIEVMDYRALLASNKCYRLMTHENLSFAPRYHDPKVKTDDITNLVLYLLLLKGNNMNIELFQPPSISSLENALMRLFLLNAIDSNGKILYPNAYFMSQVNFNPMLSAFLLQCALKKCALAGATICAMIFVKSELWTENLTSISSFKRLKDAKMGVGAIEGDFFSLYNIYNQAIIHKNNIKQWTQMRLINYQAIKRAQKIRSNLIRTYRQFNFELTESIDQESITRAMAASFFMNVACPKHVFLQRRNENYTDESNRCPYMLLNDKESIFFIHPHSFIAHLQPQCLIFTDAIYGDINYIINANQMDPKILIQEAPHYLKSSKI